MKKKFIISVILIIVSAIQLFGSEFRTVKGKVVDNKDEVFIGARIEEYGNKLNYVNSDVNGEFEMVIPKTESVVLRVTYGCSAFYDVLFEVKSENEYVIIEAYTKKANKKTKRIKRKLKRATKKDNTFFIRFEEGDSIVINHCIKLTEGWRGRKIKVTFCVDGVGMLYCWLLPRID